MANAMFFSNTAQATTLSGSISAGATSITVGAVTGFPGSFPYILAVDFEAATEELVKVTAAAGTTLTVERGYGGTSAQSHSLGAAVKHVYDATEATAFRTHEAASAAVHGLTGTVVGTSDTQTLSNKTLTSPTINGAALSGTFTGTPTFSGAVTLSGGGTLGGTFAGAHTYSGAVTMSGGGTLSGTFTGAPTLSGALTFTGGPLLSRAAASDSGLRASVSGDTHDRFIVQADGGQSWGPGNGAVDTNLYRSAANTLKTDDSLVVTGDISAANISTGAWTTWTPTWTAEGGGGSNPTLGNGTLSGRYHKVGRMVTFAIQLVWGSTTAAGGGAGSENWTFTLPFQVAAGMNGWRIVQAQAKDDSTYHLGLCELDTGNSGQVRRIVAGDQTSTAFWDSVAPFTWATGDTLWIFGSYESTT